MPKCPCCNEEIDHLDCFTKCWAASKLAVDEEGKVSYTPCEDEDLITTDEVEFECPHCQEVLFTHNLVATDFLEGKSEEEE